MATLTSIFCNLDVVVIDHMVLDYVAVHARLETLATLLKTPIKKDTILVVQAERNKLLLLEHQMLAIYQTHLFDVWKQDRSIGTRMMLVDEAGVDPERAAFYMILASSLEEIERMYGESR